MAGKAKNAKKVLGGLVSLLLTASLTLSPAVSAVYAAGDVSALKQKQAEYAQQKKENDAKLSQLRQDKNQKEAYKQTLESQISTLQNQIDTYNAQVEELDAQIVKAEHAIAGKQSAITTNTEKLKQRLCALYMSGGASNLEILLSASSVIDLADKATALQMGTEHDTTLIDTLKADMAAVKKQKDTIEQNRQDVSTAKTAVAQKQKELSGLVSEAQSVINDMASQEKDMQSVSDSLAQKEAQASEAVDQWYKEYEASQQRKKVAAQQKAAEQSKASGSSSGNSGSSGESVGSAIGSGSLMWPVPSCTTVTSPFGHRSSPGGIGSTYHKGIDIGASYGAQIVAADSGVVVQAGDNGWGYGNLVIIDHGNGLTTYYGHMSSVAVSSGQTVAKGQLIGYVGSTGNSTGPHCHFEVRQNGTAVDPMGYV